MDNRPKNKQKIKINGCKPPRKWTASLVFQNIDFWGSKTSADYFFTEPAVIKIKLWREMCLFIAEFTSEREIDSMILG